MASYNPDHDEAMPPLHQIGTLLASPPEYTTIATFPAGSFLENLAVRHDGSVLVSDMLTGSIWYVDPGKEREAQNTVELVHKFELEVPSQSGWEARDAASNDEEGGHGSYASTPAAEAIVRGPVANGTSETFSDVFYVTSGIHGKQGTWWIYEVDMRPFRPKAQSLDRASDTAIPGTVTGKAKVTRLAPIPTATWLNGGTSIAHPRNPLILMAESYQGRIYSYNIATQKVDIWLDHDLLAKITTRPPWPGLNGLQEHDGWVYFTNSDRAILGRVEVRDSGNHENGPAPGKIEVLATGCGGDDLCFDRQGNIYVATNPANTVLRFPGIGARVLPGELRQATGAGIEPFGKTRRYDHRYKQEAYAVVPEPEREVILGLVHASGSGLPSFDPETTGPTAVSLADSIGGGGDLYVVTNGGLINPLDGVVREAKLLRIGITSWEQWRHTQYERQ
jgi:hypothetical protein